MHQNEDSLSKKTLFYERQEQREADRTDVKAGFSFMLNAILQLESQGKAQLFRL